MAGVVLLTLFAVRGLELTIAPYLAVVALILPQFCLGLGSWWVSGRASSATADDAPKVWGAVKLLLASGWVLVLSQMFLQASTTLGTIVVHEIADTDVTAAYAAIEKFFNLAATFLVAIYTVAYPKLAEQYHCDRPRYWRNLAWLGAGIFGVGMLVTAFMGFFGDRLFEIHLGPQLAQLVALVLNLVVLGFVAVLGWIFVRYEPVFWVYGALLAQTLPLMLFVKLFWSNQRSTAV